MSVALMEFKSPILALLVLFLFITVITINGPAEATLGASARVVYLHGAWVWTSLATFSASTLVGLAAFYRSRLGHPAHRYHLWSRVLGRTGFFFWITYLPISLWAMQTNWNGLFLTAPRWRITVIFTIAGTLLQMGLSFLPPAWASFWNPAFFLTLIFTLLETDEVMHPKNPLMSPDALQIQVFFGVITFLLLLSAWQLSRWLISFEIEKES